MTVLRFTEDDKKMMRDMRSHGVRLRVIAAYFKTGCSAVWYHTQDVTPVACSHPRHDVALDPVIITLRKQGLSIRKIAAKLQGPSRKGPSHETVRKILRDKGVKSGRRK